MTNEAEIGQDPCHGTRNLQRYLAGERRPGWGDPRRWRTRAVSRRRVRGAGSAHGARVVCPVHRPEGGL